MLLTLFDSAYRIDVSMRRVSISSQHLNSAEEEAVEHRHVRAGVD